VGSLCAEKKDAHVVLLFQHKVGGKTEKEKRRSKVLSEQLQKESSSTLLLCGI
jgi:hypothetical protein